jgi:N-acetylneuraminic acid mutarotase
MPVALASQAVGVLEGQIYVVGGGIPYGTPLANTQIYDPATNTWSAGAPIPVATANGASAAVVNNILYVFGGESNAVWAYNPKKDSWSSKAPMPTGRGCTGAAVENHIVYVVGGCDLEDPYDRLTTVESYDPATDTWTEEAPLLVGKSQPSVARFGNKLVGFTIVAADGFTASGDTGDNEGYDATTNSWTSLAPDPMPRNGTCTGITDKVFVAGGNGTATESFNLSKNTWKTLAPMPVPTQFPGSAVYKGQLYCFGGYWGGALNNVQIYQP